MKKATIIIGFILLLIFIGFFSPWFNWQLSFGRLIGLGAKDTASSLKVYSLVGDIEVYLNNEYQGTASSTGGNFEKADIVPGNYEIKLKRKSDPEGAYFELKRTIKFEDKIDVIISYELGPTQEFSEGHILFAEKSYDSTDDTRLNITANPQGSKVFIDNNFIGEAPLTNISVDTNSQKTIKLEKEGYDTIEFKILPENKEDRDKLKGLTLNLEINMFLNPIKINN